MKKNYPMSSWQPHPLFVFHFSIFFLLLPVAGHGALATASDITGTDNCHSFQQASKGNMVRTNEVHVLSNESYQKPNTNILKWHKDLTGDIPAGSSVAVDVVWPTPFLNADYVVTCSIQEGVVRVSPLRIDHIESVTSTSVAVRITNNNKQLSQEGTIHCIAISD